MAYAGPEDLLLGDTPLSPTVDKTAFVEAAAEEIDAEVGQLYELPLTGLAPHAVAYLKKINRFLATGRLIMAVGLGASEDQRTYAKYLIKEAQDLLAAIRTGSYDLTGAARRHDEEEFHGPSIKNHDAYSAVDQFESLFMQRGYGWGPGNWS